MHYVYILFSTRINKFYFGYTSDLRKRFKQHNNGSSISTKSGQPWVLIYYEAFRSREDAMKREKKLKYHGKGLSELKRRLENSINNLD